MARVLLISPVRGATEHFYRMAGVSANGTVAAEPMEAVAA